MVNKFIFILVIGASFLTGCTDSPFYDKSYSFSGNSWEQDVKPTFMVNIDDTTKAYDFIITLRTTTDYGYSNAWIFLNTKTPTGEKAREPFELKITNADGSWIGKKSGTTVENFLLFKRKKLPQKGKYTFTIEQGITQKTLKQVLDIGLTVVEVN